MSSELVADKLTGEHMKNIMNLAKRILKDESAQGATEYILLLVIVVGLAMLFKGKIMEMVTGKLDELKTSLGTVTSS